MQDFRKRPAAGPPLSVLGIKTAGVLVLFFITVFAARGAWGMYQKLESASVDQQEAEMQLAALQAKKQKVSAAIEELSSPRGEEAEVRQRFGVARPGEGVITIVPDAATTTQQSPAQEHWWDRVVKALFAW